MHQVLVNYISFGWMWGGGGLLRNSVGRITALHPLYKNSAEVDIAPAFGEITTACNVGQAKNGSWCVLEE